MRPLIATRSLFRPRPRSSVEGLAAALTRPARNDEEKARAIFRWIAAHIAYDQGGRLSGRFGDTSPEAVLRRRESVCAGYARLFEALARAAGLQVVRISGHSKGAGYRLGGEATETNHDWNTVYLQGRWRLLDVTWGTGALLGDRWERRFTEHYFLTPPEEFIYDHFPDNPKWQLLARPLTRAQYCELAALRPAFFEHGLRVESHPNLRLTAEEAAEIPLHRPGRRTTFGPARLPGRPLAP